MIYIRSRSQNERASLLGQRSIPYVLLLQHQLLPCGALQQHGSRMGQLPDAGESWVGEVGGNAYGAPHVKWSGNALKLMMPTNGVTYFFYCT